jgi:NAD(P)-dependent dehydrogenase (short-subunit alcohol dehydrogenase family)
MAELRFDGKVAIVTGGGRGLGRSYARLLAARGCQVVVNDPGVATHGVPQEEAAAEQAVEEIRAEGGVAIADRNSVLGDGAAAIVEHALDEFGRVDVLVNNAGITGGGAFDEMPAEDFDRLVDTHYGGAVRVSRAAWPHLKAAGAGRIVSMSSASVFGTPFTSPYVSSKAGIFGLTRALAAEGRFSGIGANAVMPAAFTRMTAQLPDDDGFRTFLETYFPPEKVAPFVVFLAHESTTISGETFSVGADRAARVFLAESPGVRSDGSPESYAAQVDGLLSIDGWEIPSDMMDEVRYSSDHLGPEIQAAYARVAAHHAR